MATYIPNATQATEPVESRTVESAALEFRTLKSRVNQLETELDAVGSTLVNVNAAADAVAYLASYIDAVIMNVQFPLDLGLVSDSTLYNHFDLGSV